MALTGQHVALVNDLFSAGKERACGETYNSVLIIQRTRQCAPASAARQVMNLIAAIHGNSSSCPRNWPRCLTAGQRPSASVPPSPCTWPA